MTKKKKRREKKESGHKEKKQHRIEEEKGITESFLEGVPMFGNFFRELSKTETFKEKFKEVDEKIKENLRTGQKRKWGFEANISARSMFGKRREDMPEIVIGDDYFYGREKNRLTLAVKVPKEDVKLKIKGKSLLISSDNFEKRLELPDYFRNIEKKEYKKGILTLELTK